MALRDSWLRNGWRALVALALVIALAVPLAIAPGAAAQTESLVTAAAAPASTAVFIAIDLNLEGPQWQQAQTLLARAGLPDMTGMGQRAMMEHGAAEGDMSPADLAALLGGELAFIVSAETIAGFAEMQAAHQSGAVVDDAIADAPGGMAVVLAPGDVAAAWEILDRHITMIAVEMQAPVRETTYGDADVLVVEPMPPEEGADDDPLAAVMGGHGMGMHGAGLAAARAGDFIIAAKSEADVTEIVDVIAGDAESLADSPALSDVRAELPAEALGFTYVNGTAIVDAIDPDVATSLQAMMPEMDPQAWLTHSGSTISADTPGFRFDSITIPGEGGSLAGLSAANDPAVAAAAERAPADSFIFQAGVLPQDALLGLPYALSTMVNEAAQTTDAAASMMPTPEDVDAQIAQAAAALGFDPRADLTELLGSEFIAYATLPRLEMGGFGWDAAAAVATTDPDTLAETTRMMAAWIDRTADQIDISVRRAGEAGESVVYVATTEDEAFPPVEFGVIGEEMVIGVGDGVDELAAAPESSLADNPQFQTVMGYLPAEYSQVSYVDIGQAIGLLSMLAGMIEGAEAPDADVACGDFASQELAQQAYDEDPVANPMLDTDFDGLACEDAFARATGATGSLANIHAFATVTFQRGEAAGSSGILVIGEG